MENGNNACPVVAIGASAGGLEALIQLVQNLSSDTGAAYVILQHLSPDHDSSLAELLAKKSLLMVQQVQEGMPVEPDRLYVMQPGTNLTIADNKFSVTPISKGHRANSIDHFLAALAPSHQGRAIAVILSGTATDGSEGIRAIKSEGGITFAQDHTARFQGMPRHAIDSGFVDFVLPPDKIATELKAILKGVYQNDNQIENIETNEESLRKIHVILLHKHDVDFTLYKQTTIVRRIIRRMSLNRLTSLEQYIRLLRENSAEVDLLYKDLLINVTSFFREPTLYTSLSKKIFPTLLKGRRFNDPIRIWIPACATGEEPYSIAICLFEYLKDKAMSTPLQIFATDLSEPAIAKARSGIYNQNSLMNVSPQRMRKFFVKIDGNYQIIKPIRDVCIFATHNLLKDPPFSRMDIISCQNVLIYMEHAAQKKIMQAFHYALRPSKYLLLGKSETIGSSTDLFDQIDKDLRIYIRKSAPANMQFNFSVRNNYLLPDGDGQDEKMPPEQQVKEIDIEKEAEKAMLSMYMPSSVLVNKDLHIMRFYGSTFPYLQPASGKASLHLLKMIRDELIFELRSLVKQVKKEGKPARKPNVQLDDNGQTRNIVLEVVPVKAASADGYMLVVFLPSISYLPAQMPKQVPSYRQNEKDRRIQSLEAELKEAREHAKSMTEDFEATREELQSANEEVLSSNEELQSINEELETSKEELQSTNEELITINEELQLRNSDLKESVEFTKAIVETIREPLVVLNTDLRILTANYAFFATFHLTQDEVEGYYLYEIGGSMFDIPELRSQMRKTAAKNDSFQDFRLTHSFPGLGSKILMLNAMRMTGESGRKSRILLAIEDASTPMV
ncbi:MAG TPA: CheR family methyltransferase [Puia sp.]